MGKSLILRIDEDYVGVVESLDGIREKRNRAMELAERLDGLFRLQFWDSRITLAHTPEDVEWSGEWDWEMFEDNGYGYLEEVPDLKEVQYGYSILSVSENSFGWEGQFRRTSVEWETDHVYFNELEEL